MTTREREREQRQSAEAAALLIEPGMRVGLGTGATVAWLLRALASRSVRGLRCVASSPETQQAATRLGLPIEPFTTLDRLDIAIDGADQVARDGWLVKGGHGAHVREKVVAAAAERFIVIVASEKLVERVGPPVPLELLRFGLAATLRELRGAKLREDAPRSPDGGVLADLQSPFADASTVAAWLEATPGVVGHGLFAPSLVHEVFVAGAPYAGG